MATKTTEIGFSLRNAACDIFRHFNESFELSDLVRSYEPECYVGKLDLQADDCSEIVISVSARVDYVIEIGKGKESHYKCIFTISSENCLINHTAFRTRTISIKDADLKDKQKVIKKITEYRSQLSKLLTEAKDKRNKEKIAAEKAKETLGAETDKIKAALGDNLTEITTSTHMTQGTVSVYIILKSGEKIYTSFNGSIFSIYLLNEWRNLTTEKLINFINAALI